MAVVGARGIDVAVVVRAAALARVHVHRGGEAEADPIAGARRRGALRQHVGIRDPAVVGHRVLHRHLHPLTAPGPLALNEGAEDPDCAVKARSRVADGRPRAEGTAALLPGDGEGPAGRLADHVEAQEVRVGALGREPLHARVDDAGVEVSHPFPAKAEPLDDARPEVLDEDVRLRDEGLETRPPLLGLEIADEAPLVRVEQQEVVGIEPGRVGRRPPALVAAGRVLDLHHVRAEPGERLGAGRSGLELGEVQHTHAAQRIRFGTFHSSVILPRGAGENAGRRPSPA